MKEKMTVELFIQKWCGPERIQAGAEEAVKLRKEVKKDLQALIVQHRNPLLAGITNAIFELEQASTATVEDRDAK